MRFGTNLLLTAFCFTLLFHFSSYAEIQGGDMAGMGVNNAANAATAAELAKDSAECKKNKACSSAPPPKGPQCQQKAAYHCPRAAQEAAQQGNLGKGMADMLKNLMSALQGKGGGGDDGFNDQGYVDNAQAALASLEKGAGLTAGQARDYVKNNLKAKEFLNSDLGKAAAVSAGGGLGGGAAIAGGGSSGIEGSGAATEAVSGENSKSEKGSDGLPKLAALSTGGAGGGGGSGGGSGAVPPLEDFSLDPLPPMDDPKSGSSIGLNGDFSTLAGEKIGVPEDNLFQMLSRRYQYRKMANGFLD